MATIVLEIALFRHLLVLPPSPCRTTVETLRGAHRPLLTPVWKPSFTLCPTEKNARLIPIVVRCSVVLFIRCLLPPANVIIDGAACEFLVPATIIGRLPLKIVI